MPSKHNAYSRLNKKRLLFCFFFPLTTYYCFSYLLLVCSKQINLSSRTHYNICFILKNRKTICLIVLRFFFAFFHCYLNLFLSSFHFLRSTFYVLRSTYNHIFQFPLRHMMNIVFISIVFDVSILYVF